MYMFGCEVICTTVDKGNCKRLTPSVNGPWTRTGLEGCYSGDIFRYVLALLQGELEFRKSGGICSDCMWYDFAGANYSWWLVRSDRVSRFQWAATKRHRNRGVLIVSPKFDTCSYATMGYCECFPLLSHLKWDILYQIRS